MTPAQREKYSRQVLFAGLGETGQERLLRSSAVLVGCGALGTVVANLLVRSGVGRLRIIDRDFVEVSNLQRQTLFEESDAAQSLPKAVAAERRLRAINSDPHVEGMVADLTPQNASDLLAGFELILDGTDNFETRLLINDAAISLGVPWIYAAAVGSYGVTMTVRPGETPCLACLLEGEEGAKAFGAEATCDTAGILNAAVGVIASVQAAEALKLLAGKPEALHGRVDFLRRLERKIPIASRGPEPELPGLRAQGVYFSGGGSPAPHHHVRAGLRADSRTRPEARSGRSGPAARVCRARSAEQRFSSALRRAAL